MNWRSPHLVVRRARVARGVVMAILVVLGAVFFRLQVLGAERYQMQSKENRLRSIPVPAPRGLITDRNGAVLADNVPGYTVALLAESEDSLLALLERLRPLVDLDSAGRELVRRRYRQRPGDPVLLLRDAPFSLVSALEEQRAWYPGLVVQSEPKRRYPHGVLAPHVVGYVSEMTDAELQSRAVTGARPGALVGRTGIEERYDDRLRGRDGFRFVEVDALGRTVREASEEGFLAPVPGQEIRTTLDLELQRFVAEQFPKGARGAVVALEPATGAVLALYSAPPFDPNDLVGSVDPAFWTRLSRDPDQPLFNRAIQARYPPASPWKLAVAAMALERGVVSIADRMTIPCTGGLRFGNRYFRCWKSTGHGSVTLREAIQNSCDVYFYQLGLKLTLDNLLAGADRLGLRQATGIDLPSEAVPEFPASIAYYDRRYGPRGWTKGAVTLNLAIGQGENAQTLISMVHFYAMLASADGSAPMPYLVEPRSGDPGSRTRLPHLDLSSGALDDLREALVAVVDRGTAVGARIASLRIAGKTGTAQNPHGPDHGWFIAFAPAEAPRIVVGAIVEFAEHGSSVAPLVNNIIARYLLGAGAPLSTGAELSAPADSAPEPVLILPDTGRGPFIDRPETRR